MESRKTLINQGFFGYRGSFPLDGAGGLGGQVIQDTVDAGNLRSDACNDLVQHGVGDLLDGGGHGIGGVDGTDDGGPALVAALVLDTDGLDVGHSDEVLPVPSALLSRNAAGYGDIREVTMERNFEEHIVERAVLVGLNADCFKLHETATEETLEELEALLETAGGFCTAKVLQNRHTPDAHSFIGEGKAEEVRLLIEATGSTMAIFDNELSAGQIRALEEILGVTVLDRSALILDIFAQRAKTREGRLQVELAQYKYLLPRLSGMGTSLSRQGGGIGTRGPGETKLESDRRHIRERINRLEQELKQVRQVRAVQRERRMKNSVPVVAIVGYTNAGKSTLLNQLTGAGIPANNRLFDTLDTTSRQLTVSDNLDVILSDTVGFIAKLPHHLVDAFRATLEELEYADVLLHVIDSADPNREEHIAVVEKLIHQLAKEGTPVISAYNKADLVEPTDIPIGEDVVAISARTGDNMSGLLKAIEKALDKGLHHVLICLPYSMGGMVDTLHNNAQVKSVDYTADGIEMETVVDDILYGRLKKYIIEEL